MLLCSNYADSKFLSLSQENLSFSLFLFSSPLYFEGMYVNWMLVMRLQGLSFFILSLPLSSCLFLSLSIWVLWLANLPHTAVLHRMPLMARRKWLVFDGKTYISNVPAGCNPQNKNSTEQVSDPSILPPRLESAVRLCKWSFLQLAVCNKDVSLLLRKCWIGS